MLASDPNGTARLVWYEMHDTMESAIEREKRIKKWNRAWKVEMIDALNPSWRDLWPDITGQVPKATSMDWTDVRLSEAARFRGNDGV
jgi:putative endonuclease